MNVVLFFEIMAVGVRGENMLMTKVIKKKLTESEVSHYDGGKDYRARNYGWHFPSSRQKS